MGHLIECDVCVVGAGSGGLSVAAGTAQLGLRTVLIEAGRMGGDCLNTGCIPSKSLLAAAKLIHAHRHPTLAGVPPHAFATDRAAVDAHVRGVIDTIAPHDSVERFEGLGVRVIRGHASFLDARTLTVAGETIRARDVVLAVGSRAAIPPIPGLDPARVLTNESLFDIGTVPRHLVIVGGGPIGVEMAQAHRRLGSRVTIVARGRILPKDEPELVEVVRRSLVAEGIDLWETADVRSVRHGIATPEGEGHRVEIAGADGDRSLDASHILVAAGRAVNVEGLALERAGVEVTPDGIRTDRRLRTTNRRVHAVGDCAGGPQFTHVAGYHAGIVIRNLAFRLPARIDDRALPWVTYTDPELAHVGLTLAAAKARHGDGVRSLVKTMEGLDRAVAEGRREGLLKLVAHPNGRILGCSIVAPGAGEMIGLWCLAVAKGLKLRDVASLVLPYPTLSEISKQAAGEWFRPSLFSDRTRRLVSILHKLPSW
ncbi:dihydrolipoamide dehydrogenase [Aureimonas sp. Leaf454]|uniref:dihydrolipoyl dehydrogenase family protein n=1 Tax=Aureimonas sp. Leaf454 TaxID=1736381 RepID=UPI0006F34FE1|nr:FAD-dependent oxidoreductase [Aureimonas sp. Leaf454]KQT43173.1 dihydrolipoamide dehydrogenase [Aureimonas sp. Leaf454]